MILGNTKIELYINNLLYKTVSEDSWDDASAELEDLLKSKGYFKQYDDLPGFRYPSSYVSVWINWDKKKILVLSHKERTQLKDRNGNIIYVDDFVRLGDLESRFYAKPFNEGYYLRRSIYHPGGNSWRDTDIDETNISNVEKLKDSLCFQEKYWNSPRRFNIKTL